MATPPTGQAGIHARLIWSPGNGFTVRFLQGKNWITCADDGCASPLRISKWYRGRRTSVARTGRTARNALPALSYMTFVSMGAEHLKAG